MSKFKCQSTRFKCKTVLCDPIRCYYSGPKGTWERWGIPHSPNLQYYWSLTIRFFSVITGHSLGEPYPSAEVESVYSTAPADWAIICKFFLWTIGFGSVSSRVIPLNGISYGNSGYLTVMVYSFDVKQLK